MLRFCLTKGSFMKDRPFSRVRCAVIVTLTVILASVLAFASLFVCALVGLLQAKAAVVSLCVFSVVSAGGFLYMILASPKGERVIKAIGFAGLMFDVILVPVYGLYTIITGG